LAQKIEEKKEEGNQAEAGQEIKEGVEKVERPVLSAGEGKEEKERGKIVLEGNSDGEEEGGGEVEKLKQRLSEVGHVYILCFQILT
jgi:hypothetical protein